VELLNFGAIAAFLCYWTSMFAVITRLFHNNGPHMPTVLRFGCIALIFHSFMIYHLLFNQQQINFSLPNVVSLVSFVIAFSITMIAFRFKVNLLIPVTYGFAGLWQLVLFFLPKGPHIPLIAGKVEVVSHITLALVAYCILVIASLYAFQVSYINLKLKQKKISAVNQLPPLMQVENQLFILLLIGTVFLFVSQLTGFVFLDNFLAKSNAHKTVFSLIALIMYIIILWGHYKNGWRGHRVLLMTNIATLLLTLGYFGSRFVKEFLLS
jgi:ABC-type uncharacterized transport system permease subunit